MGPTAIMLIRHAEKPTGPNTKPHGVHVSGTPDEHSLIVRGWQRAGALTALFAPAVGSPPEPLVTPDRIFCADYDDDVTDHRVHQTVEPLAARLGVRIEHPVGVDHPRKLYDSVLAALAGAVLVCWDHEHLPALAASIPRSPTSKHQPPPEWGERFDLVWAFTAAGIGGYVFQEVAQHLLAGDGPPDIRPR